MRRLLIIVMLLGGVIYASAEDLLYVCGQKLNRDRDYNGVTEGLSSGSYSYNHSTQELVFNSATITRTSGSGQLDAIYSNINALRIIFKGTNNLSEL